MKLEGRVAVVTGGGRGIGRAIALEFAGEGANLAVIDMDLQTATGVVEEVKVLGRDGLAIKTDVTKSKEVKDMVESVLSRFKRIDVFVNNAGVFKRSGPIVDLPEEEWDSVVNVNLRGTFLCCKYVAKQMIERKEGVIINVASISGMMPFPHWGAYSPSKAAVISLTEMLALECAPYNVRVNAVCPGPVRTPLTDIVYTDKKLRAARIKSIPLNRFGETEDVAKAVVFLASGDSSYMTGQTLVVDGGSLRSVFHIVDLITKGL